MFTDKYINIPGIYVFFNILSKYINIFKIKLKHRRHKRK